ncbi:hypothetical protein AVEN_167146-1 [Araneus ventricosus]|uniref:Uncharacterized protein n=1 Tax=Araneus ventricosus TaxID=182803 RepID=A0A4Y2KNU8_ARAVE|nr:hypothetical protein AVEN_167146-1 [Araneus ventricosus]
MVFETASAGRNNSHSEQRLNLKLLFNKSPRASALLESNSSSSDTRAILSLNSKTEAYSFLTLLHNWPQRTQLFLKPIRRSSTRNTMISMIGIRSISDRRSKINSLLLSNLSSSYLPQLKSSFSQGRGPPNK